MIVSQKITKKKRALDSIKEPRKHLGTEDGDGVLGAERHQAAGAPRDVVHDPVASGPDERPAHADLTSWTGHSVEHGARGREQKSRSRRSAELQKPPNLSAS